MRDLYERLLRNVRYGLRMMRLNPGLSITILLTISIGIGPTTTIFTVTYAALIAPLPYPAPDQLVMVWSKQHGHRGWVSAADFVDWRRRNTTFHDLNAWRPSDFSIALKDQREFAQGMVATPEYC